MISKTTVWYKFMNIGKSLGCHQMAERSFFFKEYQFPICARCTGVVIGQIISLVLATLKVNINILISLISVFTMLIDWSLQYFKYKESTNLRRLITGILGGFGYLNLLILGFKLLKSYIVSFIS